MDLKQLQYDPNAIFQWKIDAGTLTCEPWMHPYVNALGAACLRLLHGQPGDAKLRSWIELPRGHGKTLYLAALACWLLLCSKKPIHGIVAACDADQARLLRDAVQQLQRRNKLLQSLTCETWKVSNPASGSTLVIIASEAKSSYGLTPDFVVADEFSHWAQNAEPLWHSLLSSAAKKSRCLLAIISNAGFESSWQYAVRENVRTHDDWFFHRVDGCKASWITQRSLNEQRALLPDQVFRRLWENTWSAGSGDALRPDEIERAVRLAKPADGVHEEWCWAAGLDLGIKHDFSALALVRKHVGCVKEFDLPQRLTARQTMMIDAGLMDEPDAETQTLMVPATGAMELGAVLTWEPPANGSVDLGQVERAVLQLHERLRFESCGFDPWQAHLLAQNLSAQGVPMLALPAMSANLQSMARELLSAFQTGALAIHRDQRLIEDLQSAQLNERSYGFRISFPRTAKNGHGDRGQSLLLALLALRNIERVRPQTIEGQLLCWP